jgi:hypothetical protein
MSEKGCAAMFEDPVLKCELNGMVTNFTQGGLCKFEMLPNPKP